MVAGLDAPARYARTAGRRGSDLVLAAAYFLAAKIGLAMAFINPSASAVWPPTGIAIAAVVAVGPRVWPGIFLGAFLANLATAGSPATSVVIAGGNTAEALLAGYLVRRFAGGRAAFDSGRHIVRFVLLAGLLSTAVSATVGVTSLAASGFVPWPAYRATWLTWWLGDAAGALVVAPTLLLWNAHRRLDWPASRRIELVLLFLVVALMGQIVFVASDYPVGFLCIPVCVWAACRFGQREAATATCVFSAMATWGTLHGAGTFGGESPNDALLLLQAFMAVTSIVGLSIGAAVSGRHAAEEQLRRTNTELELEQRWRRSERRLQMIIDAEPACVKLVSAEGTLLEMNRAGLAMLGAEDVSQIAGRPVADLIHPDDRGRYVEVHRQASHGAPARLEFRVAGLNGIERWMDSHSVPFDLPSGGTSTRRPVLSVASDVTERKQLEEQLRHLHKMEAVGLLAGGVAHDFNNLLTAIGGYTDLVLDRLDDADPRRDDLLEVQKAAGRAATLTKQLLAFGRRQMLQARVLDLNALVTGVHKLFRRTIPEHVDLVLDLDPALENVRADAGQLEQVLLNLAVNARDAMPAGGQLRFTTRMADVDAAWARRHPPIGTGRFVHLAVSDTGLGMSPGTQARIFEPFFTTKEHGRGTGLGLATVFGIVKQSDGFIWVSSQLNRGTTFDIYLPAVQAPVESVPVRARPLTPSRGSETVLVAEDDAAVRRLARSILGEYGYHVLEARDGDEALCIAGLHDGPIHMLVTDVVMPGLSGRQLADRLTRTRPDIRVLYSTGYSEGITTRAGLDPGLPLLVKPYPPIELLHRVREALDR